MNIPNAPWWNNLPDDYYRHAVPTHLDSKFPLKVHGSAAMDRILRTGLATMVSSALSPMLVFPGLRERELEKAGFYGDLAAKGDPSAVFMPPPANVIIHKTASPVLGYHPSVPHHGLHFTSPYETLNPAVRDSYNRYEANRQVGAQHWTHPGGPRPTMIFIHGYFASPYWLNSLMFSLKWFYDQGLDIVLVTQPFHGARQPSASPWSGFHFLSHGLCHANEAMLQSVFDVRVLMNHLYATGVPAIGVSGLSLGGYITALLANADERLAFAIPNSPMVSPVDMLLEWTPSGSLLRQLIPTSGRTVPDFRRLLAIHSPLSWQPVIDPRRLLVIGGAGDRFTAPRYVQLLHKHWTGSRMHWFPGNHVLHLHQRRYLKLMRDFIGQSLGDMVERNPE